MMQKHLGMIQIGHALLFAAAILYSAKVLAGTGYHQTLSVLIIVLWFASSMLIQGAHRSIKSEWACIRRFFSSTRSTKKP